MNMNTHADDNYQNREFENVSSQDVSSAGDFDVAEDVGKEDMDQKIPKKSMPPKFVFGVLLVLAVGTLIYGFINLSRNIYGSKNQFEQELNNQQVEQSNLIDDLLTLQSIDTDKDGLSDYDELYIYKTSPYLPDTDSDGYLDKDEIDNGYDPLCPKGQDCRGTGEGSEVSVPEPEMPLPPEDESLSQELIDELSNLTPDQIKQLLLESGEMTQEQINQIDDSTLMSIYQEVLGSQ